jgi:predicted enzyme related to lactoylglutathione lyase
MLQHAGIEIAPEDVDRAVEFFALLGFIQVEPPPALADDYTWVEREGTQVHLMHDPDPTAPPRAHLALMVEDFDIALARLQEHGFEVQRGREHWGAPRAVATCPGNHRIELMSAPPPRA